MSSSEDPPPSDLLQLLHTPEYEQGVQEEYVRLLRAGTVRDVQALHALSRVGFPSFTRDDILVGALSWLHEIGKESSPFHVARATPEDVPLFSALTGVSLNELADELYERILHHPFLFSEHECEYELLSLLRDHSKKPIPETAVQDAYIGLFARGISSQLLAFHALKKTGVEPLPKVVQSAAQCYTRNGDVSNLAAVSQAGYDLVALVDNDAAQTGYQSCIDAGDLKRFTELRTHLPPPDAKKLSCAELYTSLLTKKEYAALPVWQEATGVPAQPFVHHELASLLDAAFLQEVDAIDRSLEAVHDFVRAFPWLRESFATELQPYYVAALRKYPSFVARSLYDSFQVPLALPAEEVVAEYEKIGTDFLNQQLRIDDAFIWLALYHKMSGVPVTLPVSTTNQLYHALVERGNVAAFRKLHHVTGAPIIIVDGTCAPEDGMPQELLVQAQENYFNDVDGWGWDFDNRLQDNAFLSTLTGVRSVVTHPTVLHSICTKLAENISQKRNPNPAAVLVEFQKAVSVALPEDFVQSVYAALLTGGSVCMPSGPYDPFHQFRQDESYARKPPLPGLYVAAARAWHDATGIPPRLDAESVAAVQQQVTARFTEAKKEGWLTPDVTDELRGLQELGIPVALDPDAMQSLYARHFVRLQSLRNDAEKQQSLDDAYRLYKLTGILPDLVRDIPIPLGDRLNPLSRDEYRALLVTCFTDFLHRQEYENARMLVEMVGGPAITSEAPTPLIEIATTLGLLPAPREGSK